MQWGRTSHWVSLPGLREQSATDWRIQHRSPFSPRLEAEVQQGVIIQGVVPSWRMPSWRMASSPCVCTEHSSVCACILISSSAKVTSHEWVSSSDLVFTLMAVLKKPAVSHCPLTCGHLPVVNCAYLGEWACRLWHSLREGWGFGEGSLDPHLSTSYCSALIAGGPGTQGRC